MDGEKTPPWSQRQRTALTRFRKLIAVRAQREEEIATGTAARTRGVDQEFAQAKEAVQQLLAQALAAADAKAQNGRAQAESRYEETKQKADADFTAAKNSAVRKRCRSLAGTSATPSKPGGVSMLSSKAYTVKRSCSVSASTMRALNRFHRMRTRGPTKSAISPKSSSSV